MPSVSSRTTRSRCSGSETSTRYGPDLLVQPVVVDGVAAEVDGGLHVPRRTSRNASLVPRLGY